MGRPQKSEDELLAKGVPDLDLILSGHTHSRIQEPIRHGDTYVVSCGEYGKIWAAFPWHRKRTAAGR